MGIVKSIHNGLLSLRYSLPIWIDNHTSPPLIRTTKHRWYSKRLSSRVQMVKRLYEIAFGYEFDIDNPQTLNEKIQWLKLFYPNPLVTQCADKYAVREYIENNIGGQYLAKLLGVYDKPEQIDFSTLPEQFALKVNWGSGQNLICKDKSKISESEYKRQLKKWIKPSANQFYFALEWGYRDMKPKIVCEEYVQFLEQDHKTYQFFCFNGKPQVAQVIANVKTPQITVDCYDMDWKLLPFKKCVPVSPTPLVKPDTWEQMIDFSERLSKPFPFVRVDFFANPEQIVFNEMTFYPGGGLDEFQPSEWDLKLGEMLHLPDPVFEDDSYKK